MIIDREPYVGTATRAQEKILLKKSLSYAEVFSRLDALGLKASYRQVNESRRLGHAPKGRAITHRQWRLRNNVDSESTSDSDSDSSTPKSGRPAKGPKKQPDPKCTCNRKNGRGRHKIGCPAGRAAGVPVPVPKPHVKCAIKPAAKKGAPATRSSDAIGATTVVKQEVVEPAEVGTPGRVEQESAAQVTPGDGSPPTAPDDASAQDEGVPVPDTPVTPADDVDGASGSASDPRVDDGAVLAPPAATGVGKTPQKKVVVKKKKAKAAKKTRAKTTKPAAVEKAVPPIATNRDDPDSVVDAAGDSGDVEMREGDAEAGHSHDTPQALPVAPMPGLTVDELLALERNTPPDLPLPSHAPPAVAPRVSFGGAREYGDSEAMQKQASPPVVRDTLADGSPVVSRLKTSQSTSTSDGTRGILQVSQNLIGDTQPPVSQNLLTLPGTPDRNGLLAAATGDAAPSDKGTAADKPAGVSKPLTYPESMPLFATQNAAGAGASTSAIASSSTDTRSASAAVSANGGSDGLSALEVEMAEVLADTLTDTLTDPHELGSLSLSASQPAPWRRLARDAHSRPPYGRDLFATPATTQAPVASGGYTPSPPTPSGASAGEKRDAAAAGIADEDEPPVKVVPPAPRDVRAAVSLSGVKRALDETLANSAPEKFFRRPRGRVGGRRSTPRHLLEELSLDAFAKHLRRCSRVVVLCGAGISVAAGIPDFRTPGVGLYSQLGAYNLPYPEAMFDMEHFERDPHAFYHFMTKLWPGVAQPTAVHTLLHALEASGRLLRVFTQNIDGLERAAGVSAERLVEAHGHMREAHCVDCGREYPLDKLQAGVADNCVPLCGRCGAGRLPLRPLGEGTSAKHKDLPIIPGLLKPKIVFFNENLPLTFERRAVEDMSTADAVIVVGTSMSVAPFANLPRYASKECPRLMISLEARTVARRIGFELCPFAAVRDVVWAGDAQEAAKIIQDVLETESDRG